jgi:hypothetical protein
MSASDGALRPADSYQGKPLPGAADALYAAYCRFPFLCGTVDGVVQDVDSGVPDTGFAPTASYVQADAKAAASATAPVSVPQSCNP